MIAESSIAGRGWSVCACVAVCVQLLHIATWSYVGHAYDRLCDVIRAYTHSWHAQCMHDYA